jgi:hypothetical protein
VRSALVAAAYVACLGVAAFYVLQGSHLVVFVPILGSIKLYRADPSFLWFQVAVLEE